MKATDNGTSGSKKSSRASYKDYKEMSKEILETIKDEWILKQVYLFMINITKEET
jgi:hypothetical protein